MTKSNCMSIEAPLWRLRNDLSSQGTDEAEREANYFAAALLMPKRFLERDLHKEGFLDLTEDTKVKVLTRRYGPQSPS